ncbi:MAG TPA: BamA/TamA family outer membrane protein, partial [Gemmatimonadales bacterium]|nr:BamA/TamA family outer membrane protein [Gemmatimonadales bacterium]
MIAGGHNRDAWVTPVRVPALSVARFAGGLTPLEEHAGSQTRSLRLVGADGRQYQFRSVNKSPALPLPPELQVPDTASVFQDGVSASFPAASLVVSALLDAADVLHPAEMLAVLPDDPALGRFRKRWAGVLGTIEERATDDAGPTFAGARGVTSASGLFKRIDTSPDDRVDAAAFLRARLVDILVGDRDRHRDQFRWATTSETTPRIWLPISRDHDEAFVKLDGPVLDISAWYYPPIVNFEESYPPHYRLNWHAREVDRRFLVGLGRATWDSVARALEARLSDSVIESAVRRLPAEIFAVSGARLKRTLEARRNQLVHEALSYYAFLAEEVEIRATDAPEIATITRVDNRYLDLSVRERRSGSRPYVQRRFDARETREIRLKMWGGDDSVIVRGEGKPPITLRVVGGSGADEFVDSSRSGGIKWYDDSGPTTLVSIQHASVNSDYFREWVGSDQDRYPPREWGTWWRPYPWVLASTDIGVLLGVGVQRTEYGFRRAPFASDVQGRAGYATGFGAFGADVTGKFHPENASHYWRVDLLTSGFEILHYYGLGNNTAPTGDVPYHQVNQQHYRLQPSLILPIARALEVSAGPIVQWSHTGDNTGKFLGTIADTVYGGQEFGQVGGRLAIELETRDQPANARRGLHVRGEAKLFPAVWDVSRTYGAVDGDAATFLSAPVWWTPTLALHAGGKKLWGPFPFYESAFLGGRSTLRGFPQQRFAGDASVYGSAELRVTLLRSYALAPSLWGVFGSADAGRVYLKGASPGGWHSSSGGGIWASFLDRGNTAILGFAHSV